MPTPATLRRRRPLVLPVCVALVAVFVAAAGAVAAAYRYKDERGQWVYTDRPPVRGQAESVALGALGGAAPRMVVVPRSTAQGIALVAVNPCKCTVEFAVKAETVAGLLSGRQVVAAESEMPLLDVPADDGPSEVRYEYGYVVGEPNVAHRPPMPYRAPFALAQRFRVTQAPPDAVTHTDAASRNAIDIAMPIGTAVHAAREGLVIDVARNHFRSGLQLATMGEANFVQILHDDGTYAIYAHLQMDTVRVRPGQRVARGEYIANSGNTGFSSGPHLHFVVLRNVGLRSESLPVTFAGSGGAGVTPRSGQILAAY
ncbi:MAG TPA: M23 family metallopeptidase [Steroidobacteraceae bacterium]|nr:M23 family metallopeptidase [Steroidobacteraceae bacterium]